MNKYCVSCHNEKLKTAGLALDRADADNPYSSQETWEKVIVKLRSRAMPPPKLPRPDNATYDKVAAWLESEIDRAAAAHVNPGRSASLHRLNRREYANAVRDLIAVEVDPKQMLPPDEQAFGFENNAEALSMQPALLDRYVSAAAAIARQAVGDSTIPPDSCAMAHSKTMRTTRLIFARLIVWAKTFRWDPRAAWPHGTIFRWTANMFSRFACSGLGIAKSAD